MNIYVHTAGVVEDYTRRQPENAPPMPPAVRAWHRELDKNDAYFALAAGRTAGGWYVEYRNLLLPKKIDIRNRKIVLNICFGALKSEAQVRALALAYLDFELIFEGSKCAGRLCPQLTAAYREQGGDYAFDFSAAQHWAEAVLDTFSTLPPARGNIAPILCHTNPAGDSYLTRIREELLRHRLQEKDGLRLLWAEVYLNPELPADILLQYTTGSGSFTRKAPAGRCGAMLLWVLMVLTAAIVAAFLYF